MIIVDVTKRDLEFLSELEKQFNFPLAEKSISTKIIRSENDGSIIAVGQLLPFTEVSLMASQERSKAERVEALQMLMKEAMFLTQKLNLAQLHGFVKDNKFADILVKHWGFQECQGKALVLNL